MARMSSWSPLRSLPLCVALSACGDDSPATGDSTGDPLTGSVGTSSTGDDPDTSGISASSDPGTTGGDSTTAEPDPDSSTGPAVTCGNDLVEGDEVCDGADLSGESCVSQGYDAGELACAPDCAGLDTSDCSSFACGNGIAEGPEQCDGNDVAGATCLSAGFDSGTLDCNLDCTLDTDDCGTCGNVIVDGDEVCDDIVLLGQTCQSQGYDSGQLGCAPDCLTYDASSCGTCDNGIIDGAEECDMGDLGGATCLSAGFDSGTLACDDPACAFDTSGCGICGNGVVDGDETCDDGNTGTQCLPGCIFCPGGLLLEEDFSDNMAGWTLGTEWAIGPAVASVSPGPCGNGDPGTDHTPTMDNGIAGVVIGGNASTGLHPFYYLTSPVVDAAGYSFLELSFWRWLNSDYTPYMQNHIQVWDGAAWQTVWQSGGSPGIEDAAWTYVAYDIAAYANAALQVRIGFTITSGGVYTCSGWNVDDLQIVGVTCP